MVPYKRSQSRNMKATGSRSAIRLNDVSSALRYILWSLANALYKLWDLNPVSLIIRRWRQLHRVKTRMALSIRPRLIDLATDFFLSDERRKRKLLNWVKSILPWLGEEVLDFSACWQDGIILCSLMESISPGACPRFNLLKPHHRVNNCRLGIQLAMRYLHVNELHLSPEEIAIADDDSEVKICQLVQLLKWKYQKQGSKPTVFSNAPVDQAAPCKCQARGTGIKAGIVGKRTKFNILADTVTNLDLQIEIRGPNNEYNKERIISMSAGSKPRYRDHVTAVVVSPEDDGKTKVIEDGAGHSFLRQKSQDDDMGHLVIPFDYQCVGEGRFLVTYIPRTAGLHYITVLSKSADIPGSPFEVKVSDWVSSWNLVPKPRVVPFDMIQSEETMSTDGVKPPLMRKLSNVAQVSKQLTRMKRRILRKVITSNGEEIICEVTPNMSRQNSGDLDLSQIDGKDAGQPRSGESHKRKSTLDENSSERGLSPLEVIPESSLPSPNSQKSPRHSGSAFLATVVAARAAAGLSDDSFIKSSKKDASSDGAQNGKEAKHLTEKMKIHGSQFSKDESKNPEIVITPDCGACVDGPGFPLVDSKRSIRLVENPEVPEAPRRPIGLSSQTDRDSIDVSISSPPTVVLSSTVDSNGRSSVNNSLTKASSTTKPGNSQRVSFEDMNGCPSGNETRQSKSPSPHPRVSDVVGSLLSSLRNDKRDGMVSPSQRNYMRSFSLDETHPPYISYNENVKTEDSSDTLGSVSRPALEPSNSNDSNSDTSSCQKELISSVGVSSASSSQRKSEFSSIESYLKSSCELPLRERGSSTAEPESSSKYTTQLETANECGNINCCSDSPFCEIHERIEIDDDQSPGEVIYCPEYAILKKEPAIMKHDLDQRVTEIIEETSERDSVAQEEDISETSTDGFADEEMSLQHEHDDFAYAFNLGSKSRSLTDITKAMEAASFSTAHFMSSLSISDFRPRHKIAWSQHKSLSEDQHSKRKRNDLTRKEWADIISISISKPASLEQSSDTDEDILSSDCEEGSDGKSDHRGFMKNQYAINGFAKEISDALLRNSKYNKSSRDSARKGWSQSRAMSYQVDDTNEPYWKEEEKKTALSFNGTTRRDQLSKFRKWATFDVLDMADGDNAHIQEYSRDEMSQVQDGFINGEIDEDDEEILKIITEIDSYQPNVDECSRDVTGDLSSGKHNASYVSSRVETSPNLGDDKISVTQEQADDVMRTSPLSDVSSKSDNSDSSDNEESPPRGSTNHASSGNSYLLKGDWSPQFFDLTYPGGDISRRGSTNASVPSPNSSRDNVNALVSPTDDSAVATITVNCKLEDECVISPKSGAMESKETQYEHPIEVLSSAANITNKLISTDDTPLISNKDYSKTSTLSPRQNRNINKGVTEHVSNGFVAEESFDEHTVYRKRRSIPVYTNDSFCSRCNCQSIESSNESRDVNNKYHSNSESHARHNAIHTREAHFQISNLANTNSNLSTSELRSPDSTANLPVDNWSSLSGTYADCRCKQAAHFVNDGKKYTACQHTDPNCRAHDKLFSRPGPFREYTLTPTKYRVRHENTRGNFKTNQQFHERMMSSHEKPEKFYTSRGHSKGSTSQENGNVNLKLVMGPGSVMVSLCPGDRTLTPTKYRRNKSYHDNVHTRKDQVQTEIINSSFDMFNEELQDSKSDRSCGCINPEIDVHYLHNDVQNSPSYRSEGNNFPVKRESCAKSNIPIGHKRNDKYTCLVCADNSKITSKHFNNNEIHTNSQVEIMSPNSNGNDRQIRHADNGGSCLCCEESLGSHDRAAAEHLTPYVKRRRKMFHRDDDNNPCCCNDNNDFADKNSTSTHKLFDKLFNHELGRDIDGHHINTSRINIDNFNQVTSTQHQIISPLHHPHQHYTERNDDHNQLSQQTNQQDCYLPHSLRNQEQEHHPTEYTPRQPFMSLQENGPPFNQSSSLWNNLHGVERSHKPTVKQNTNQHQSPALRDQNNDEHGHSHQQYTRKPHNNLQNKNQQFNYPQQLDHQQLDQQIMSLQQLSNKLLDQQFSNKHEDRQFSNKHQHQQFSNKHQHQQFNSPKKVSNAHQDEQFSNKHQDQQFSNKHQDQQFRNKPQEQQLTHPPHKQQFNFSQQLNHPHHELQFNSPQQLNHEQQFNFPQKPNHPLHEQQFNFPQQPNHPPHEQQFNFPQKLNHPPHEQQFNFPQKLNHPPHEQQFNFPQKLNHPPHEQQFNFPQQLNHPPHEQQFNHPPHEQQLNSPQQPNHPPHEQQFNFPQKLNHPPHEQQFNFPQKLNHPPHEQQFNFPQQLNHPPHEQQFNHPPHEQQFNSPQQLNHPPHEQQFNSPQQLNHPPHEQQFNSPQQLNHPPHEQQFNSPQQLNHPPHEQQGEHMQQQHRRDNEGGNNQALVLRRQSTVDTLDSGIPEDSTLYYGQISGNDSIDGKMLDLENGFDFNIFLEL